MLSRDLEAEVRRLLDGPSEQWAAGLEELARRHPGDADALRTRAETLGWNSSNGRSAPLATERTDNDTPAQVGPYYILEVLGEGGMGTVYMAEQRHPVRRRVALKVIKLGMDSKAVLARFDAERQALSMMEHSAVARIYDAGISEQGRSYFAMEYVKGVPITDYCDQNRLSLSERIELFRKVCSGVQHAHLKGVMHRDLKPSNVLVTVQDGKPMPKIIDFGLAKAMDHRLVEATLFTEHGQVIGTPEYMSPEQAGLGGLDVDTRTDVYSLGVLLYELLTGGLPFTRRELLQHGYSEMQRILRETEPPKPSTRLTTLGDRGKEPARLRRIDLMSLRKNIRGDLDWIVMKALEKDRTRRYETALELAADLQRHLAHIPVFASPPSLWYRASKYVRRNRAPVLAGFAALVAAAGWAVTAVLGWQRAQELTIARERTALLRLLRGFAQLDQALARERELRSVLPEQQGVLQEWLERDCAQVIGLESELHGAITQHQQAGTEPSLIKTLTDLRDGIGKLRALQPRVQDRLMWARKVAALTEHHPRALVTWEHAATRIAASANYREVPVGRLPPQVGLVPIGENPATGLWEFYHLHSAWSPGSLERPEDLPIPAHEADGNIRMTEAMGIVFVLIPGGRLRMGASDDDPDAQRQYETPVNEVPLEPYLISRFELTQGQWLRMSVGERPSYYHPRYNESLPITLEHPVESVSWEDCVRLLTADGCDLPTEAQWEWACRAGKTHRWWSGDAIESLAGVANVFDLTGKARSRWDGTPAPFEDGYFAHAPVGSFRASPFGLHDVHGNVWEWCRDRFNDYGVAPALRDGLREVRSPVDLRRLVRGGSFADGAQKARSSARWAVAPTTCLNILGVRPARPIRQ